MDEERRANIATALRQYRATVSQHNSNLLRTFLEGIEEQPLPPNVSVSVAYLDEICQYFESNKTMTVRSPRDLLNDEVRAEFISQARVDGVSHFPVNLKQREEYFAGIQTRIADKVNNVEVADFPPVDLAHLCTLVSGITGPGLSYHKHSQQIDFVSSIEDEVLEDMLEAVTVPVRGEVVAEEGDEMSDLWIDWEIAVAVMIGGSPFDWAGSYALYCRNKDNEQWEWRYSVHDNYCCSNVYNSVEGFLDF